MNKLELPKVDLTIYSQKLKSGLDIYIVPKKDATSTYVTLITRFGSMHDSFKKGNKSIKIPAGTAHFLEHKVFEQYDRIPTFQFFSERGAESNASTSKYHTAYYFSTTEFLDECLDYLLNCVYGTKLSKKGVEKEKGIITQEIKMYKDSPSSQIFDLMLYNSFVNHPIRYSIGGSIDSINVIDVDILKTCYDVFYQPSNMFMVVVGNVEVDDIITLVENNFEQRKDHKDLDIELETIEEPNSILEKNTITKMNVIVPKIAISFKVNISKYSDLNIDDIINYFYIYFYNKFGYSSAFNEKLKAEEIINSDIEISIMHTDKHLLISLMADSKQTDDFIRKVLEENKTKTINKKDLERAKKTQISSYINNSDSIFGISYSIVNQLIKNKKIRSDGFTIIEKLNFKDYQNLINGVSFKNYNITIINSNK